MVYHAGMAKKPMAAAAAPMKEASITFRAYPDLKAALEAAAMMDGRSVSGMADRILREWLVDHGFLMRPGGAKAPAKPRTRKGGGT